MAPVERLEDERHVLGHPSAEHEAADRHAGRVLPVGSIDGHCEAGAVKRESGWAAGRPQPGVQTLPVQSIRCAGGASVIPSHQTSPSSVSATLVKIAFLAQHAIALGLEYSFVPGATPKNPASGLIARNCPRASS